MIKPTENKVSIIMPVYNAGEFLGRSIESILTQTYSNFELILVDDGSIDNSKNICDEYARKDSRIIYVSQVNKGVSAARNKGITKATGNYVSFIDADDYLENRAIESMMDLIHQKNVDVLRMHWREIREKGSTIGAEHVREGFYHTKKQLDLLRYEVATGGIHSFSWLLLIRREVLAENNIRFPEGISMMEDTCFYVDLINWVDSVYISDTVTYNYVIHNESASRSTAGFVDKLDGIVKMNGYIINSDFSQAQQQKINASHASVIANMLMARVTGVFARKDILALLKAVHGAEGVGRIFEAADIKYLDLYHKVEAYVIMRRYVTGIQILKLIRTILKR